MDIAAEFMSATINAFVDHLANHLRQRLAVKIVTAPSPDTMAMQRPFAVNPSFLKGNPCVYSC